MCSTRWHNKNQSVKLRTFPRNTGTWIPQYYVISVVIWWSGHIAGSSERADQWSATIAHAHCRLTFWYCSWSWNSCITLCLCASQFLPSGSVICCSTRLSASSWSFTKSTDHKQQKSTQLKYAHSTIIVKCQLISMALSLLSWRRRHSWLWGTTNRVCLIQTSFYISLKVPHQGYCYWYALSKFSIDTSANIHTCIYTIWIEPPHVGNRHIMSHFQYPSNLNPCKNLSLELWALAMIMPDRSCKFKHHCFVWH